MAKEKEEDLQNFLSGDGEEEDESDEEAPFWGGDEKEMECLYSGYQPKGSEVIDVLTSLPSPKQFFEDYVSKRKPCIIDCLPNDKGWCCTEKWSNKYLIEKAGDEMIEVERRKEGGNFGLEAPKTKMRFGDFVGEIDKGDTSLYLTTQTIDCDERGLPTKLFGPPLHSLKDDFPLVPDLLGNLVPNNLNVWMGNSTDGSCSGLHHDFHDNLYVVVRGLKQFELFSPGDAAHLSMHGKLSKIHPNGLINYKGSTNMTREDGVPFFSVFETLKEEAESAVESAELELAEAKGEKEIETATKKLAEAESKLEEVMEFEVEQEFEGEGFDDDGDDEDDDEDDTSTSEPGKEPSKKRRKIDPEQTKTTEGASDDEEPTSTSQKAPDHFSKIDLTKDRAEIFKTFPELEKSTPLKCQVKSGQMLYLPASWFHCVTSFAPLEEKEKGHIAFNYWVHPPASSSSFENPYNNDFWKGIFQSCVKSLKN